MPLHPEVAVVGASILDIPVGPVGPEVFAAGTHPVPRITLDFGGDALNEATVLSRLGRRVRLVSVVGDDDAGQLVLSHCRRNHIATDAVRVRPGLDTGVNIVLIAPDAERSFITSSSGGLRALRPADIPPSALDGVKLLSFASIFVFPHIQAEDLSRIFQAAKQREQWVCADMTKPKNKETLQDMQAALQYVDFMFPNYEEASLLSGKTALEDIADAFLAAGVGHIAIKTGKNGCFLKYPGFCGQVPAVPDVRSIDTTGAGDCFAAGFIHALLEGYPPPACARFANAAASLAVESVGATSGVQGLAQVMERFRLLPE